VSTKLQLTNMSYHIISNGSRLLCEVKIGNWHLDLLKGLVRNVTLLIKVACTGISVNTSTKCGERLQCNLGQSTFRYLDMHHVYILDDVIVSSAAKDGALFVFFQVGVLPSAGEARDVKAKVKQSH